MEVEDVTFQFLREITDDFSEEQKLGEGAFGVVYKVRFVYACLYKQLLSQYDWPTLCIVL